MPDGDSETDRSGTVILKFYKRRPINFSIAYTDKQDLFNAFQKHLESLDIPIESVFWLDADKDHVPLDSADSLLESTDCNHVVRAVTNRGVHCSSAQKELNAHLKSDPKSRRQDFEICSVARVYIAYENRQDLFESFKKEIERLKIPPKNICWKKRDKPLGDIDKDTLMRMARDNYMLRFYVHDSEQDGSSSEVLKDDGEGSSEAEDSDSD